MTHLKRIYLAGPEVFFPAGEQQAIVAEQKSLLREYGFEGGIRDSGSRLFVAKQPGEHRIFSAELFRSCVRALACAQTNPTSNRRIFLHLPFCRKSRSLIPQVSVSLA